MLVCETGLERVAMAVKRVIEGHEYSQAFERHRPRALALESRSIERVMLEPGKAALAMRRVANAVQKSGLRPPFTRLDPNDFDVGHLDDLESLGQALYHAGRHQALEAAATRHRGVPKAVVDEAVEVRARMLRVADYMLSNDPKAARLLAFIREGSGHVDRAEDLLALIDVYKLYEARLAADAKWYRPEDTARAAELANAIVNTHDRRPERVWPDLTARIWTISRQSYDEVRAAAQFLFRHDASKLKYFPSLFSAVKKKRKKKKKPPAE